MYATTYYGDDICFDQPSTGNAEIDLRIDVAENRFNQLYKKLYAECEGT